MFPWYSKATTTESIKYQDLKIFAILTSIHSEIFSDIKTAPERPKTTELNKDVKHSCVIKIANYNNWVIIITNFNYRLAREDYMTACTAYWNHNNDDQKNVQDL